jgi:hypothetical protein
MWTTALYSWSPGASTVTDGMSDVPPATTAHNRPIRNYPPPTMMVAATRVLSQCVERS